MGRGSKVCILSVWPVVPKRAKIISWGAEYLRYDNGLWPFKAQL